MFALKMILDVQCAYWKFRNDHEYEQNTLTFIIF